MFPQFWYGQSKSIIAMIQSFFLHNCFSIIQVMGINDDKSRNKSQKDCNAMNLAFHGYKK